MKNKFNLNIKEISLGIDIELHKVNTNEIVSVPVDKIYMLSASQDDPNKTKVRYHYTSRPMASYVEIEVNENILEIKDLMDEAREIQKNPIKYVKLELIK